MGEKTSTVRYEPCDGWVAGADVGAGTCAGCGWFEEDHWLAELERGSGGGTAPDRRPVSASA